MGISRRAFLTGSLSGAAVLVLAACTTDAPSPAPTTGGPTPTPTEAPTAPAGVAAAGFLRSRWADDALAGGSSSYLATGSTVTDRLTLAGSLDDRLFFAGEAVAARHAGTVHGARASGFDVADQVASVAAEGERVAVIGAGIAGATAARALADRGFDVVVVEARDRIGGRIHTVADGSWPFPVELGVSTLFGEASPALVAALALAGVDTVRLDGRGAGGTGGTGTGAAQVAARTADGATTDLTGALATALATASAWADDTDGYDSGGGTGGGPGISARQVFAESGADRVSSTPDATGVSDAERVAFLLDTVLPARFGAEAGDLAMRQVGDDLLPLDATLVTGGLESFVTGLLDGLDVLRGSTVVSVQYGDQGVGLRLATGESLSADRVVSTIPLGVLKQGAVEFEPELPAAYASAVESLGMGDQEVLWLRFDRAFWSTEATVWAVLDDTASDRLFVNLMPSTGEPILVSLTGGDAGRAAAALDDDEAVTAALASLEPYLDLVSASPTPSDEPTVDPSATPGS
jgi:monoamine oxidase